MKPLTVLSAAGQVAEHLRGELLRGGLGGTMPGVESLAEELGVKHKTVRAALRQLEDDGLLISEGPGRHRRIVTPKGVACPPAPSGPSPSTTSKRSGRPVPGHPRARRSSK